MFPLTMNAAVLLIPLFALVRHDKPAREPALARRTTSHRLWKSEEDSERRPIEPGAFVPRSNKSSRLNWEMLALWSFVAVSFAALFAAGYVIWAKCDGPSPLPNKGSGAKRLIEQLKTGEAHWDGRTNQRLKSV